jgi:hypothetical protein
VAGLGQNLETEPPGLDFGHAVRKDGEGLCGEVVRRCVQGGNGGRVVCEREAEGCRPKVENRAAGARFRARHRKGQRKAVWGGSGEVRTRW